MALFAPPQLFLRMALLVLLATFRDCSANLELAVDLRTAADVLAARSCLRHPPLEEHMLRSRGEKFRALQSRVNAFFPAPRRQRPQGDER